MYYLRTKAAANAIQFTVDKTKLKERKGSTANLNSPAPTQEKMKAAEQDQNMAAMVCSLANKDDCLMCGS